MAKNKDDQAKAPAPEESKVPAMEESNATEASPEPTPAQVSEPELLTLEELAAANRVPGWQSAALHRLMGWEPGKQVTEAEYRAGLDRLKTRRIGG
jgi:hypothetical protein